MHARLLLNVRQPYFTLLYFEKGHAAALSFFGVAKQANMPCHAEAKLDNPTPLHEYHITYLIMSAYQVQSLYVKPFNLLHSCLIHEMTRLTSALLPSKLESFTSSV